MNAHQPTPQHKAPCPAQRSQPQQPQRIALIGYGAIGKDVVSYLRPLIERENIQFLVFTRKPLSPAQSQAHNTIATLQFTTDKQYLWDFEPDLLIEAAGQAVVQTLIPEALSRSIDVVIASVGALADASLYQHLHDIACQQSATIWLPSGAIAGLDYIQSLAEVEGLSITYESRKPTAAWLPELQALGLAPEQVTEPIILYEGSATEAAKRYPQNLNVAATLALAGVGMDNTQVKVVVDPALNQNQHHILVQSPYGEMRLQLSNAPSPDNPKSSWIVARSVASVVLKRFAAPFKFL